MTAASGAPTDRGPLPARVGVDRTARVATSVRTHAASVLLGVLSVAAAGEILSLGRGTTFFVDEWMWIQHRRGWGIGVFLEPHNGHLSAIPIFLYHVMFAIYGLHTYFPYRLMIVLVHLSASWLLYIYARRRLGNWVAVLPAALLLFLGCAYQDLLWPFQVGFVGSVAFGLGAFVLLDRRSRRANVSVALCLVGSLACSGLGIGVVAAAGVRLVLERRWRQLWLAVAPTALFVVWYAKFGTAFGTSATSASLGGTLFYAWHAFLAACSGLIGVPYSQAPTVAAVAGGVVVTAALTRIWFEVRAHKIPAALCAGATFGVTFWILTGVSRAQFHEYDASRYLYPGAVAVLLVLIEVLRDKKIHVAGVTVLVIGTVIALVGGQGEFRSGAAGMQAASLQLRAELGALEVAQPDPTFEVDPAVAPGLYAGDYLAAVRSLGSPALPLTSVSGLDASVRNHVDSALLGARDIRSTGVASAPAASASPPDLQLISGDAAQAGPGCVDVRPAAGASSLDAELTIRGAGTVVVEASDIPVEVSARRFGSDFQPLTQVAAGGIVSVGTLGDGVEPGWRLKLSAPGLVTICG